jgi:ubiquinone/menaquinone biosynthesis C-methylase UbiE
MSFAGEIKIGLSRGVAASLNAVALQRKYYEHTALNYDRDHLYEEGEHDVACRLISAFLPMLNAASLLDVGCGTGRAVGFFRTKHPELIAHGVEPVAALVNVARQKFGADGLLLADGARLPFRDASYDVVLETGMLHHVGNPEQVVGEMLRVARKAVFLSDHNIFGQGSTSARVLKWLLYQAGLWKLAKRVLNRGRDYHVSEGDGVAYSYSVFWQYRLLQSWTPCLFAIPTRQGVGAQRGAFSPLFAADEVLLCAIKTGLANN